jgi:putative membrane protein
MRRPTSSGSSRPPPSGSSRPRLRVGAAVGGLVGAGLLAWLLLSFGVVQILQVLVRVGWLGMAVIVLLHLVQMLFSALGWQVIAAGGESRPRLRTYLLFRWVREAVNNLLPLAQIGGELVAVRLLRRRGVPLAAAIGGTIADLLMEMATQVVFTVTGAILLIRLVGHSEIIDVFIEGLLLAASIVLAAFAALRLGLAAIIEKAVIGFGSSLGWPATAQIGGLHMSLLSSFRAPGRVALSALWHLLSWFLGGAEVCLVLHFFGQDIGLVYGLVIESLGQAAKSAGFAIPGAVGVQEGGYVVVGRLLGIPPEIAIALSLIKRLREILLGVPGLFLWHRSERTSGDHAVA